MEDTGGGRAPPLQPLPSALRKTVAKDGEDLFDYNIVSNSIRIIMRIHNSPLLQIIAQHGEGHR